MDKKKFLKPAFYKYHRKEYLEAIKQDIIFNATFRNGSQNLSFSEKRAYEFRAVKLYRKYQVNKGNFWGYYYKFRLDRFALKTGIDFLGNSNIGTGLLIGHWGRIVINGNATFGSEIMLTHNVTIGRDIRGKRAGSPHVGNRVCIRTNSTVVGNITIGDDVLIAPNTFVNFDVPSHSIVIGNPAKIIHRENATEGHMGILNDE